jgi:hypothetical protein
VTCTGVGHSTPGRACHTRAACHHSATGHHAPLFRPAAVGCALCGTGSPVLCTHTQPSSALLQAGSSVCASQGRASWKTTTSTLSPQPPQCCNVKHARCTRGTIATHNNTQGGESARIPAHVPPNPHLAHRIASETIQLPSRCASHTPAPRVQRLALAAHHPSFAVGGVRAHLKERACSTGA